MSVTTAIDTERSWAKEHPEPMTSIVRSDQLDLWNYPVNGTDLAPSHQQVIREFAREVFLEPSTSAAEFVVTGYASATGAETHNASLADVRAQGVGKFLRSAGFTHVGAGAGTLESGSQNASGLSYARQRRVVVELFLPPLGSERSTATTGPAGSPLPSVNHSDASGTTALVFTSHLSELLAHIETGLLVIDVKMTGELTMQLSRVGVVSSSGGLSLKDRRLGAKFEAELVKGLKGKLGITPASSGKPTQLNIGVVADWLGLKWKGGFENSATPLYLGVRLVKPELPKIVIDGVVATMRFDGGIQVNIGLTPTGAEVAGAALVDVAEGVAIAIAVLAVPATIYFGESAREEHTRLAQAAAVPDGAASEVAFVILGDQVATEFQSRQAEWIRAIGSGSQFGQGKPVVDDYLAAMTESDKLAKIATWTKTYAAGTVEFGVVRRNVLMVLTKGNGDSADLRARLGSL